MGHEWPYTERMDTALKLSDQSVTVLYAWCVIYWMDLVDGLFTSFLQQQSQP